MEPAFTRDVFLFADDDLIVIHSTEAALNKERFNKILKQWNKKKFITKTSVMIF